MKLGADGRCCTDPGLVIEANTRAAFPTAVPEPAGLGLVGAGLGALLWRRRLGRLLRLQAAAMRREVLTVDDWRSRRRD